MAIAIPKPKTRRGRHVLSLMDEMAVTTRRAWTESLVASIYQPNILLTRLTREAAFDADYPGMTRRYVEHYLRTGRRPSWAKRRSA